MAKENKGRGVDQNEIRRANKASKKGRNKGIANRAEGFSMAVAVKEVNSRQFRLKQEAIAHENRVRSQVERFLTTLDANGQATVSIGPDFIYEAAMALLDAVDHKNDNPDYASVVFGTGPKSRRRITGVRVWNRKKMAEDRAVLDKAKAALLKAGTAKVPAGIPAWVYNGLVDLGAECVSVNGDSQVYAVARRA